MTPDTLRIARDKLTRVFRYLEALNQHRNPPAREIREQPWVLWLRDLPDHLSVQRGAARSDSAPTDAQTEALPAEEKSGEDFVLKVGRPKLTCPPRPPAEFAAWLQIGWDGPAPPPLFPAAPNNPNAPATVRT